MKKIIILSKLLLIAIILLFFTFAIAEVINVPNDQPTIQDGIDIADSCDTVLVQPGTYVENINYNGKNITVGSLFLTTQDTIYISQTIIDGYSSGSVVTFENGEDSTSILTGFIITNGQGVGNPNYTGGGITCINNSNPILKNVTITGNSADAGGGILCWYSSPSLEDGAITSNSASKVGGGICCSHSSLSLTNLSISGNTANWDGGGIYFVGSSPYLTNVSLSGNTAGVGGGILCMGSNPSLTNVTICGNSSDDIGGGIFCDSSYPSLTNVTISENCASYGGGIWCYDNTNVSLLNCILWNNIPEEVYFASYDEPNYITIFYSDVQGGETGIVTNNNGTVNWLEGNIDADPLFADPENGDFHLTWANFPIQDSTMSPCIDAGNPDTTGLNLPPFDLDGNPRIVNGIIDMGAYEWQGIYAVGDWHDPSLSTGLFQNYPNPFSTSTTISFNLTTKLHEFTPLDSKHLTGQARIKIYNVKGQLVRQLSIENSKSSIEWDGKDENGNPLSSGIYFYKLEVGDKIIDIKKCLLLK